MLALRRRPCRRLSRRLCPRVFRRLCSPGWRLAFWLLLAVTLSCWTDWLSQARATSISPWTWEDLQGLTQQSDTIFTGRVQSVTVGDRSLPDAKNSAVLSVVSVAVGDPKLAGGTLTVEYSVGDQPLSTSDALRLFFVARSGDRYRLSFFHTWGALPIEGDNLAIWLQGKPRGSFYSLSDVLARVRRDAQARIVWSAELPKKVEKGQPALTVSFVARNLGSTPMQVLLPSHHFDALWARRVLPGNRLADDWQGVSHWDHHKPVESLRVLPAKGELRLKYAVPLSVLGMAAPGTYRVGVRLEPHRRTQAGDRLLKGRDLRRVWLGGLDHFSVDVVVD